MSDGFAWKPFTDAWRKRIGMAKKDRPKGKIQYVMLWHGEPIGDVRLLSSGHWQWSIFSTPLGGNDSDPARAKSAAEDAYAQAIGAGRCPCCGHDRDEHRADRSWECSACACGHGASVNLWGRHAIVSGIAAQKVEKR